MSKGRKGFSYSKSDVKKAISYLAKTGVCERICIYGSRSPKSKKEPRQDSDWDFLVVTKSVTRFPNVAKMFKTDVDIRQVRPDHSWNAAVEVWPNDNSEILK